MFKSILNRFWIVVIFTALELPGLYAQQDNMGSGTRNDEGRIQQDPFVPVAQKLSQSLKSKIQLDDDQTNKVRDILINYYSKVRDVQGIQRAAARDITGMGDKNKKGKTGSGTPTPIDKTGTSGSGGMGSGNYGGSGSGSGSSGSGYGIGDSTGSSGTMGSGNETQRAGGKSNMDNSEIIQSLRDNDVETNTDIEDVLNDNQKTSWINVKTSWWQEVKQEVYSFNPASNMDHNKMDTDKNKSKTRGSGTGTDNGTNGSGMGSGSGSGTSDGTERR